MRILRPVTHSMCRAVLLLLLTMAVIMPSNARALDLTDTCSGLSGQVIGVALVGYDIAVIASESCHNLWGDGFTGDLICALPDVNLSLAVETLNLAFEAMLSNNTALTIDMLECADVNDAVMNLMLDVMDRKSDLLGDIANIMRDTSDGDSCEFTELFVDMAGRHEDLKDFFFAKIDNDLYDALTYSMACEDTNPADSILPVVEGMADLLKVNAAEQLAAPTPMVMAMMNLGTPDDRDDANEMANERMFYYMFRNVRAASDFFEALQTVGTVSPQMMQGFMSFMFLGVVQGPDGSFIQHESQAFYNGYAMIRAFVEGIAPGYDMTLPPGDPSDPENYLLGNFMAMLFDTEGMTPYGQMFLTTMVSGASRPKCDPYCNGMMQMMMGFAQMGKIPYTYEQALAMIPTMIIPEAPAPRNFIDGSGDEQVGLCEYNVSSVVVTAADSGTITPALQSVIKGGRAVLDVTPAENHSFGPVRSDCGGIVDTIAGQFTTNQISTDCLVEASFVPSGAGVTQYTVTPVNVNGAGTGGDIIEATPQQVAEGGVISFHLEPQDGFALGAVTAVGCTGHLDARAGLFTSNAITQNCTVTVNFVDNSGETFAISSVAGDNGTIDPE